MSRKKLYLAGILLCVTLLLGGIRAFASAPSGSETTPTQSGPDSASVPQTSLSLPGSLPAGPSSLSASTPESASLSGSIPSSAAESSSTQIESDPPQIMNAAETIQIPDGQTLVLGADGAYLLRSDGGQPDLILAEEWETPTGLYDANTLVAADGPTGYLRSTVAATVAGISSPEESLLELVDGSDITVAAARDIGVDVFNLRVGSMETGAETRLHVTAPQVAIQFTGHLHISPAAQVTATAAQNAILYPSDRVSYYDDNLLLGAGAQLDATATGAAGVAVYVDSMQVHAASVAANAPDGVGGVKVTQRLYLLQENGQRASLHASSATGRAISAEYIDISSSDVRGVTAGGSIGVHSNTYINLTQSSPVEIPSTVYGAAYSGYGVVAQNIDAGDQEYPSGSIYIENGSLEGYVQEGMGISSNTMSVYKNSESSYTPQLLGTAERGIGISACMLNVSEEAYVHGTSNGASNSHFQVYNVIPNSAGINILSYLNLQGNVTVVGEAPPAVAGSFGIHCMLLYEGSYASGSAYLYTNLGQSISLRATGETGFFAISMSLQAQGVMDVTGSKDGMVLTSLHSETPAEYSPFTINTRGNSGHGLKVYSEWEFNPSEFWLTHTKLNAAGGEYGLYVSSDGLPHFTNSEVTATANGPLAVAGGFIQASQLKDPSARATTISGSYMEASSPNYGWLFQDTPVMVDALAYTLPQQGRLTGTGGESGIKIQFTGDHTEAFGPDGEKALVTTDMELPDGSPYTILGVSTTVPPDQVGRAPAISVPSSSIDGKALVREEYLAPAIGQLSETVPYPVYAAGMNVADYTRLAWQSPTIGLEALPDGLIAVGNGAFLAEVSGESITSQAGDTIALVDGTHQIQLLTDANIGKVTFNSDGGAPQPEDQRVPRGGLVEPPPPVEKPGYNFVGWYNTDTGEVWNFDADTMYGESLLLLAKWEALPYTLTFDGNATGDATLTGMPQNNPLTLFAGDLIPAPTQTPQRTGAQFSYWSADTAGIEGWDFENSRMPPADMTLYAIWGYNEYVVTYQATNGEPETQTETVRFGQPVPGNITTPQRTNFIFDGWYTNTETTIPWESGTLMPASDITLYAKWTRTHSSVTFDINGGDAATQPAAFSLAPGETASIADFQPGAPKAPQYSGHFFLGWVDDAGNAMPSAFTVPQADVHLKAQWQKAPKPDLPDYVVAYRSTKTRAEIEGMLAYTYEYVDLLGQTHRLSPRFSWDDGILSRGGTAAITVHFSLPASGSPSVVTHTVTAYVLNFAEITASQTQTFAFGQEISQSGAEWNPTCVRELPDFQNKTIRQVSIPTTFHLRDTNIRVAGTYSPQFTAVYSDYFGGIHNLSRTVTAIILPQGQVPSSTSSSSGAPSSSRSGSLAATGGASGGGSPGGTGSAASGGSSGIASDPSGDQSGSGGISPTPPTDYDAINRESLESLREQGVPIFSLGNLQIPLHSGGLRGVWGLANLLLMLASIIGTLLLLLRTLQKIRNPRPTVHAPRAQGILNLAAMLLGPAICLLFLLTQNTRLLMVFADRWTPYILILGLVQLALALVALLRYGPKSPEDNPAAEEGEAQDTGFTDEGP